MSKIVKGLVGSSASFYISKKIKELEINPPIVIATSTLQEAENIFEELRLFLPDTFRIEIYKPWDVKPYDLLAPHSSIISERLSVLWQLLHGKPIIVAPITSLLQKVIPKDFLEKSSIKIETFQNTFRSLPQSEKTFWTPLQPHRWTLQL